MAALPYMPLYVADYLADTAHLTALENGAYLLLIMNYWQRGKPLTSDDSRLARIARLTDVEWKSVKPALQELFICDDEQWSHRRIESELAKVEDKSQKAAKAGRASAQRRSREPVQRTFNHTDTDTYTEPNGSAAKAPDARSILFIEGLTSLKRQTGKQDKQARAFLGKLLKATKDDARQVLDVVLQAERDRVADPESWMLRCLGPPKPDTHHTRMMSAFADLADENTDENQKPHGPVHRIPGAG